MPTPEERLNELAPQHRRLPGVRSTNPLDFPGYEPPDPESVVTAESPDAVWIVSDFSVLGGSMGAAAGHMIAAAYDRATEVKLPVVAVIASGGARMQEGMVSLVQMPRTLAARSRHRLAGLGQLSVLTSPSTGGVYASWGALADVTIAEPGATVGFAGPRVVKDMLGEDPDLSAYESETKHRLGLIDAIVEPRHLPETVHRVLRNLTAKLADPTAEVQSTRTQPPPKDTWELVQAARNKRPAPGIANEILNDTFTLTGAMPGPDDDAVLTVMGAMRQTGQRIMVIAQNSASPRGMQPHGYRKAQRAIDIASRLGLPVLTLIDTRGADPLPDSERNGISVEIARTTLALLECATPTTAVVTGEGGSGGALALAACDRLLMQATSIFSVIAPEGASSILHRTPDRAPELAAQLKVDPVNLERLGIIDGILSDDPADIPAALATAPTADRFRYAGRDHVTGK